MATYASFLKKSGVDGSTVRLNGLGQLQANVGMEPFSAGTKDGHPAVFYVDGNVVSSGDGTSWRTAVKTLTEGLALAHAYQRTSGNRAWAHRSTVYVCGDDLAETIVTWAQKTDVIGVGSDDSEKNPRILGHHVVTAWASGANDFTGCRLFNITFKPSTTTVITDIPDGQHGFEFHNCKWEQAASCTTAIRLTTCQNVVIDNCRFVRDSNGVGFSTAAISIATGNINNTTITNNFIDSAIGILVNSGTTGECNLIQGNTIIADTLTIDDNSSNFYCIDNRLITATDCDAYAEDTGFDFNVNRACNNYLMGSGSDKKCNQIPPEEAD